MDFETFVVSAGHSFDNALLLDRVGTTILKLESAIDLMLELIKEIVERLSLSCGIVKVSHRGVLSKTWRLLLLRRGQLPLLIGVDLSDHGRKHRLDVVGSLRVAHKVILVFVHVE